MRHGERLPCQGNQFELFAWALWQVKAHMLQRAASPVRAAFPVCHCIQRVLVLMQVAVQTVSSIASRCSDSL